METIFLIYEGISALGLVRSTIHFGIFVIKELSTLNASKQTFFKLVVLCKKLNFYFSFTVNKCTSKPSATHGVSPSLNL